MGKLKYSNLKEVDKAAREHRKKVNYAKKTDSQRSRIDAGLAKKRLYYKQKFSAINARKRANERIKRAFERTRNNQKGKSRSEIKKDWQKYNATKAEIKYGVRTSFDSRLRRFEFPIKLDLSNFKTVYREITKKENKGRSFRSLLVYIGFTTPEGVKRNYSSAYPYQSLAYETLYEFTQDAMDAIPKTTSQGIVAKIVELVYLVYFGSPQKTNT